MPSPHRVLDQRLELAVPHIFPPLDNEPVALRAPFDVRRPIQYDLGAARRDREDAILEPLAGIALGAYDQHMIEWLSKWDTATVGTFASLLHRARTAGPLPTEDDTQPPQRPAEALRPQGWGDGTALDWVAALDRATAHAHQGHPNGPWPGWTGCPDCTHHRRAAIDAVYEDNELLNRLAAGEPPEPGDPLGQLLAAWLAELDDEHTS